MARVVRVVVAPSWLGSSASGTTKRKAAVARSTVMKRPAAAPKPAAALKSILKKPAALAPGGAGWLPKGWKVWKPYAGRSDKYYRNPCGTEMRSVAEVRRFLGIAV